MIDHHGRGRHSLWCNAPLGVQELLLVCFPEELRAVWNGRPGTEP